MAFCPNCGFQLTDNDKFCPSCGNAVQERQTPVTPVQETPVYTAPVTPVYTAPANPIPTAPVYTAPTAQAYQAHTVTVEPEVPGNVKAKGFVGMGLGIGGLVLAVIGILYTLVGMEMEGLGFGMSIGFGIFTLPMGIIGRSLSGKSLEAGFRSGAVSAGSKLGLATIIVTAVMLFFGFINLMV